ncbi:hypothetical protein AB0I82_14070 [Streptomyces sp. NPDC050315]|uniref:DUF7144 family membrane protein n=1 Tax=Streptomyces sp. NPDC050315 TaxID=3155039 RepID=UPI00341CE381
MSNMPGHADTAGGTHHEKERQGSAWASGGRLFAGVLMVLNGLLGVVQGIAGIAEDDVYGRLGDYFFKFNISAWGWILLILGILVAVTGWGVLQNALWARATAVAMAAVSVLANFIWLPYQPIWGIVSIAIGVFVIWSLCTDRSAQAL